jgi:hypothetical protein
MNRFSSSLDSINFGNADGVKGQMFSFFKRYFKIMGDENSLSNATLAINQLNYNLRRDIMRKSNVSYQSILSDQHSINQSVKEEDFYASMYSCPSVSSDFLNFLLKVLTPGYALDNMTKNTFDLSPFFASNFMSGIRHLDNITTYVSVVFSLLKQTTRYSTELNADTTIFSVDNPEPFSLEFNVEV